MADVEELLGGVPVRLAPAQAVRARGERRRTRKRVGLVAVALVAATAAGTGSWDVLTPGPHGRDVTTSGGNPFVSHGVVQNLQPAKLPMYALLHWRTDGADSDTIPPDVAALPQAGLNGVCDRGPDDIRAPGQQFTSTYTGVNGARARYRVSQYADAGLARDAIRALGRTLHGCGLKELKEGGGYSGTMNDGSLRLDVGVQRWGAWVGVVETQYVPTS